MKRPRRKLPRGSATAGGVLVASSFLYDEQQTQKVSLRLVQVR